MSMEFRLAIPVQNADSENSVISGTHTATSDLEMKIFLGFLGESEDYLGN